jgi:hypothetical protein
MIRAALVLGAMLSLAACHGVPAPVLMQDAPAPVCAPFRAWSDADLKALAQALKPVPEDSIIIRMALDWRRYYGDAKACGGAPER